jgi:hypothetical protein
MIITATTMLLLLAESFQIQVAVLVSPLPLVL